MLLWRLLGGGMTRMKEGGRVSASGVRGGGRVVLFSVILVWRTGLNVLFCSDSRQRRRGRREGGEGGEVKRRLSPPALSPACVFNDIFEVIVSSLVIEGPCE